VAVQPFRSLATRITTSARRCTVKWCSRACVSVCPWVCPSVCVPVCLAFQNHLAGSQSSLSAHSIASAAAAAATLHCGAGWRLRWNPAKVAYSLAAEQTQLSGTLTPTHGILETFRLRVFSDHRMSSKLRHHTR